MFDGEEYDNSNINDHFVGVMVGLFLFFCVE